MDKNKNTFNQLMTICWLLFSLAAITGIIGWLGYEHYTIPAEVNGHKASIFEGIGLIAALIASVLFMWNTLCHTIAWIITGRLPFDDSY